MDIDVLVMVIGEADRGHDDEVVEIMVLIPRHLYSATVTGYIVPIDKTDIDHGAVGEPTFVTLLVLHPDMLVMMVVFVVGLTVTRRHRLNAIERIMPHQALKELVSPTDSHLVATVQIRPFAFRKEACGKAKKA